MSCPLCREPGTVPAYREPTGRRRAYHDCPRCGLVFLDPAHRVGADEERRRYRSHRNDPDEPGYAAFLERLAGPLTRRVPAGSRGLDYGSGPGEAMGRILSRRGLLVDAYDPHFRPETPGRGYDFVVCCEAAEHFHRPADEFARIDACLSRPGVLAVSTRPLEDDASFADWWYRRDVTHVSFYRPRTFDWIARRHGWSALDEPRDGVFLFSKK